MKIAIHPRKASFSGRWMDFCKKNNIAFKIVNCYDSDIIEQIEDCDALMWHYSETFYKDVLFAKGLLFSLEQTGKVVFPNMQTGWHFNDKVGQKYLLESIGAPLVPSYVFYDKPSVFEWVKKTSFPKVFKLRGGFGSQNVSLVKSKSQAVRLIKKSFGSGFSQFNRIGHLKETIRKFKSGKSSVLDVLKASIRLVVPIEYALMHGPEKGYIYFQDFIPNNNFDIRVVVIGDKAFALKRLVRQGDFRASGSGRISYEKDEIDLRCIKIAFDTNKKINSQSIAYDFVFNENNDPLIVEISYGFHVTAYDSCIGFWDSELNWHEGVFNPQEWMIENLISEVKKQHALS